MFTLLTFMKYTDVFGVGVYPVDKAAWLIFFRGWGYPIGGSDVYTGRVGWVLGFSPGHLPKLTKFSKLLCQKRKRLTFLTEKIRNFQNFLPKTSKLDLFSSFLASVSAHSASMHLNDRSPTLRERLTQQDRDDLHHRRVTTTALAKKLGVSLCHLSRTCPGKIPGLLKTAKTEKKGLLIARNEYRHKLALEVIAGRLSRQKAVDQASCSDRTFWRHMANARA